MLQPNNHLPVFTAGPSYVLKSFPDGYRFFDHHKGPAAKPRQDVYLYGALAVLSYRYLLLDYAAGYLDKRFRSKAEFIPHAIWLMNGMKGKCECKYCSKRTQKEITAEMGAAGIIPVSSISMSPSSQALKKKPREQRSRDKRKETRTYAAIRPVRKVLKPSPGILTKSMLVDRDNDLRAIYASTSMELKRWFREEEVVWCILEKPIIAPDNPNILIQYWPGVVDEVKFKAESLPRPKGTDPTASSSNLQVPSRPSSSTSQADPNTEDTIGPRLDLSEEPVPWTVRHYTKYKIQLLAVSHSYIAADHQVLPYPAHIPPEELIDYMLAFDPDKLVFEAEKLSQFNPCPGSIPPSIYDAIPAYAAALQIASALSSYWSLTDEYEVKYSITPSPPPSPKPARIPLPTRQSLPARPTPSPMVSSTNILETGINQTSMDDAQTSITFTPHTFHRDIHDIGSGASQSELQRTTRRIVGMPPAPGAFVQIRFQGIWWGTERIWVDDFIRLKVPRRTLAPYGTDHILPPSGPGKLRSETYRELGQEDVTELGAGGRGVFLRLDSIFAVDVPTDDGGSIKEARVCGKLYELADEDWEEPPTDTLPESQLNVVDQPGPSTSSGLSVGGGEGVVSARVGGSKHSNYPLPQPPDGYRLRPILKPGYEFIGALGLISGRYYPKILSHPKLRPIVEEQVPEAGSVATFDNLWALEGLSGGYFNSMDPLKYKKSRMTMMQDADREALSRLREFSDQKRKESKATNYVNMDVDFDDIYA